MTKLLISSTVALSFISTVAFAAPVTFDVDGVRITSIKRCGMEWKATKATRTEGVQWPQYWSACAKVVKTKGASKIGTMGIDTKAIADAMPKPIEVAK